MTSMRRVFLPLTIVLSPALFLLGCEKGPDRAEQALQYKSDIERQLQTIERDWASGRLSHESVAVEPIEGAETFGVTIKGMKLAPEPGATLTIGDVGYVFTPKDEKTFGVSDLKLPAEMPYSGPNGELGKLSMQVKSLSGTWSREFQTFLQIDSEFADIVATDTRGANVSLQSVKATGNATDKGQGIFDVTSGAVIKGMSAGEQSGGRLVVGEVTIGGKFGSLKLKEYVESLAKIQELTAAQMAALDAGNAPPPLSPEQQKSLIEQIDILSSSFGEIQYDAALGELSFEEPDGSKPFNLAKAEFLGAAEGLAGDSANLALVVGHSGLAIEAPEFNTPIARAVLPRDGKLSIKATDIPTKSLRDAIAQELPEMLAGGASAEASLMQLALTLQSLLASSGAKISVEPSGWTGEVTKLDAEGAFTVNANAILGAVGTLNLALHGLDDLIGLAQANPTSPESQQVLGFGQMLQAMSNRETGGDGKPVDKFKIDLTEQGEMLVNGKPMGM